MLADDVLRNAEKNFGCKLPTAYIELLKIQILNHLRFEFSIIF